jgi:hypothetical protein
MYQFLLGHESEIHSTVDLDLFRHTTSLRLSSHDIKSTNTMSRSALWRQEANVQERERQARDAFLNAVEEGRVRCVQNTQ